MVAWSTYSGSKDGWILRPPYFALSRILGGTKTPNETAMMRLIGSLWGFGGYDISAWESKDWMEALTCQPVEVSISWMGNSNPSATFLSGTDILFHVNIALVSISSYQTHLDEFLSILAPSFYLACKQHQLIWSALDVCNVPHARLAKRPH